MLLACLNSKITNIPIVIGGFIVERLQKILANAGVASRRMSADIIKEGRVTVDGKVIYEPGARFDPSACKVRIDGNPISVNKKSEKIYIMLNKPMGYISTTHDPRGRKTVLDLIPSMDARLFPVGRLDRNTEGLLLLTNDGLATYALTHPKFEIYKTYVAVIKGIPGEDRLDLLRNGVRLSSGHLSSPAFVQLMKNIGDYVTVEIKIREGRKRQIREMFDSIGHPVKNLTRTHVGDLTLGDLKIGSWRHLVAAEESWIQNMISRSRKEI